MVSNKIRTSKKVATKAAKALTSGTTSKITKTLGGAALVNRKKNSK